MTKPNPNRSRSRNPRYGDQTACRECGHDIKYHGKGVWIDRGANTTCPEFIGYDTDGIPQYRKATIKHKPVKE